MEGGTDPANAAVQPLIKLDHGVRAPELLADLLTGDQASRLLDEHAQDGYRLLAQRDEPALLAELAALEVKLEQTEADEAPRISSRTASFVLHHAGPAPVEVDALGMP